MNSRSWTRQAALPAAKAASVAAGTIIIPFVIAKTPVSLPWLALVGVLIFVGTFDGKRGVRFEPLTSWLNSSKRAAQVHTFARPLATVMSTSGMLRLGS